MTIIDHEEDLADFKLFRLIEWAGLDKSSIKRITIKEGHQGVPFPTSGTVVTMGQQAFGAMSLTGSLDKNRGYLVQRDCLNIIPTVSAKFVQRGQSKLSAAVINDLQKAAKIESEGVPLVFRSYLLDPSPLAALQWAESYLLALRQDPSIYLAFDIETPGKPSDEEDLELDDDNHDRTWTIERIGFSWKGHSALSVPFEPPYFAAIRALLNSTGPKVVWNAGFDVPRLRHAGFPIAGIIHDGLVAWHILHSDLPKSLKFVATFTCWYQSAWKHLSGSSPAFYNATDADVELRSMLKIEEDLKRSGLWAVYERDVIQLEPVLQYMSKMGMPVDQAIREDRAVKIAEELKNVRSGMEQLVPVGARKIAKVFVKPPRDLTGLLTRPGVRPTKLCPGCGAARPPKSHYKTFVKKLNPCAGLSSIIRDQDVDEYYRLAEFTPSRDQLSSYHNYLKRPLPTVWDKQKGGRRVSFGERQIRELSGKYPQDELYKLILRARKLEKLGSTYLGRPV